MPGARPGSSSARARDLDRFSSLPASKTAPFSEQNAPENVAGAGKADPPNFAYLLALLLTFSQRRGRKNATNHGQKAPYVSVAILAPLLTVILFQSGAELSQGVPQEPPRALQSPRRSLQGPLRSVRGTSRGTLRTPMGPFGAPCGCPRRTNDAKRVPQTPPGHPKLTILVAKARKNLSQPSNI